MARLKIDVSPSLQRLDLVTKGLVNTKFMGNYASAFKGTGLEFANYRSYTQNDDASLIDWRASNRSRKLLIKEFVEERDLNVFFLLDVSSKMLLGSTQKLKCEYAAELVSSFSHIILKEGDHVGLIMYADGVIKNIKEANGMKHFQIISDVLSEVENYGGGFSLKNALEYLLKSIPGNSLVVVVSDFINLDDYRDEMKFAAKKFDLIGIMVRDVIDCELPEGKGQALIEDPVSGERMLISPSKFSQIYSSEVKKEIADLTKSFKNAGADFLPLYTNKPFVEDLVAFFKRRELEWK